MTLVVKYRAALAVLCVAGFYANMFNYLFLTGRSSVHPVVWIAVIAGLTLALTWDPQTWRTLLGSPVIWWCAGYIAMTVIWFMWSSQSATAVAEVMTRVASMAFLGVMVVILADPRVHGVTRIALAASAILAVVLNVVDILRPLTFSPLPGRAAGLYLNPNGSAISLALAMIMTLELFPQAFRPWYMCVIGMGVLLTSSRGGVLVWLLAALMMVRLGAVRLLRMAYVLMMLASVGGAVLFLSGRLQPLLQVASLVWSDASGRLRLGPTFTAYEVDPRFGDAVLAWNMFLERPVIGHGVAATVEWDRFESTHNVYLRHLVEYGAGGLLIMPLLAVALLWPGSRPRPRSVVCLAAAGLLWGMFSHNILDEREFLLCVALAVAMSEAAKDAQREPASPDWAPSPFEEATHG